MNDNDIGIERDIERVLATKGNVIDHMKAAGLNPLTDFRGGDWRGCDFRGLNLERFNFQNARIFSARFEGAKVEGADFRNTEVWLTDFHKAQDWEKAKLKPDERERVHRNALALTRRISRSSSELGAEDYNNRIRNSETYDEAQRVFRQMLAAGYAPDHFTYTALVQKAPDEEVSLELFREAKDYHVKFDNALFNAIADKMYSYDRARSIFDEMLSTGIKEAEYDYNVLINKSRDFRKAIELIGEMRSLDITPSAVSYNTAMKWADGIQDVNSVLDEMAKYGVPVRAIDIAVAIRKLKDDIEIDEVLSKARSEGISYDTNVYNALIMASDDLGSSLAILRSMVENRNSPDRHTFYALLSKANEFSDALSILNLVRAEGIAFDSDMVRLLIRTTADPLRSRIIRAEIEGNSGGADDVVRALVNFWIPFDERAATIEKVFGEAAWSGV